MFLAVKPIEIKRKQAEWTLIAAANPQNEIHRNVACEEMRELHAE